MTTKKRKTVSMSYFRKEAVQEYVRQRNETILPQFTSTRLMFWLWMLLLGQLFLLAVLSTLVLHQASRFLF